MSTDPLTGRPRGLSSQSGLGNMLGATPQSNTPQPKPKTLNMSGAYVLSEAEIAKHCSSLRPHGNYAFGKMNEKNQFLIYYVGRFNHGGNRLKHGIGKYSHFKISHAATEKEAVEKECQNYHDFTPPDNKIHPACPTGMCCPRGCS